jgi:hypothetical protein
MIMQAANARIELIARNLAETGFRERVRQIIRLSSRHPEYLAQRTIQLSGQPLQLTADDLVSSYDLVVNTGIGTGNREAQLAHMQLVLQTYQMLQQAGAGIGSPNPLFSTANLYNALTESLRLAGYRNTSDFYIDPQNPMAPRDPPAQPKPSVEEILAQVETQKAQVAAMKTQADTQESQQKTALDAQKARVDAELRAAELRLKEQELALQERQLALDEYKARAETNARLMEAQAAADKDGVASVVDFERELFDRGLKEREIALRERELASRIGEIGAESEDEEDDGEDEPMSPVLQALEALREQITAPKRVVRDADGKVVGVETVPPKTAATAQ